MQISCFFVRNLFEPFEVNNPCSGILFRAPGGMMIVSIHFVGSETLLLDSFSGFTIVKLPKVPQNVIRLLHSRWNVREGPNLKSGVTSPWESDSGEIPGVVVDCMVWLVVHPWEFLKKFHKYKIPKPFQQQRFWAYKPYRDYPETPQVHTMTTRPAFGQQKSNCMVRWSRIWGFWFPLTFHRLSGSRVTFWEIWRQFNKHKTFKTIQ